VIDDCGAMQLNWLDAGELMVGRARGRITPMTKAAAQLGVHEDFGLRSRGGKRRAGQRRFIRVEAGAQRPRSRGGFRFAKLGREDVRNRRPTGARSVKHEYTAMKKPPSKGRAREMRAEYDFSGGVRGKYVDRYRRGTNVMLLDPELAEAFPDSNR